LHTEHDHSRGDRGYRKVDEKRPPPAPVLDDDTAGERTQDGSETPNTADESLHPCACFGRKKNSDEDERQRIDGAAAETLNGAEENQHLHALSGAAQRCAEHENNAAEKLEA